MEQYYQLTQNERYLIASLRQQGVPARTIALRLRRHHSAVYREVKHNATMHDRAYRPQKAHVYAGARRWKARSKPQYSEQELARVDQLLREDLSPEQCCGVLRAQGLSISWPTIYRHIRRDRREGGTLWRHLRIISKFGRKRYRSVDSRGVLAGKRHISERPPGAARRSRRLHWEGDTVMGADGRHCVLTLVERKTGYVIMKKLSARSKEQVTSAIKRAIREHLGRFRTITFDNGTEFHDYKLIEWAYPVRCYFATPYHSWERGINENIMGDPAVPAQRAVPAQHNSG